MIRYLFDILIRNNLNDFVGNPIINNLIWLSKEILAWSSTELPWTPGDSKMQNILFEYCTFRVNHFKLCNWLLRNSFYELEPPAWDYTCWPITFGQSIGQPC